MLFGKSYVRGGTNEDVDDCYIFSVEYVGFY